MISEFSGRPKEIIFDSTIVYEYVKPGSYRLRVQYCFWKRGQVATLPLKNLAVYAHRMDVTY